MRLNRLDLTRYGRFTDARLDFGPAKAGAPDLHIVYGLNEAGKSTSLSAFLDLLFGIEQQSRYNFLHPYAAMEIGAVLEIDGETHRLIRRKQRTASLTDETGRGVNEALVGGALGGLTRDSYRAMFSLDDETLEAGGEAILQSKGDLGELLFSASAGLSGIGAALAKAEEEADAIHRRQARSTAIYALRQRLEGLDATRREIDTAASAHNALATRLAQAEESYGAAVGALDAARRRRREIEALLRALPRAREAERLRAALDGDADLPRPPESWREAHPKLLAEAARTQAETRRIAAERARIESEMEAAVPDTALLALRPGWRALEADRARHMTAGEDLPKRRRELEAAEAGVAAALMSLGAEAGARADDYVLAADLLGALRERIAARGPLAQRLGAARRELADAEHALAGAEAKAAADTGNALDLDALAALDAARGAVRRSDAAGRLKHWLGETAARRRLARERLDALLPWRGEAQDLRALHLPDDRRTANWRLRLADIERRGAEARARGREAHSRAGASAARLEALRESAGRIDDGEASALRAERDEAWAAHRADLSAASASRFAERLAADDHLTELRLSRARDLGELRHETTTLAEARQEAARCDELRGEAEREAEALAGEIAQALPQGLGADGGDAAALLSRLEGWARRQEEALDAVRLAGEAEREGEAAKQEAERLAKALRDGLAALGRRAASDDLLALADAADALVSEGVERRARQGALAEDMRGRRLDLERRRREAEEAAEAARNWAHSWTALLRQGWLAGSVERRFGRSEPDFEALGAEAGAVAEMLPVLAELPARLRAAADLRHRIETMESNRSAFADGLERLFEAGGLALPEGGVEARAAHLAEALAAAEATLDTRRALDAALFRLAEDEARAGADRERLAAETRAMIEHFGVSSLEEVGPCLDAAAERARREARLADLERDILADLGLASLDEAIGRLAEAEPDALGSEGDGLDGEIRDLDARREALFREKSEAADALERIGGDDAVARLMAERRTVILEMEDLAARALRLRAGALIAGEALRLYRDRHRSAMMDRASQAFGAMTRGDYTGLATQGEGGRESLIGLTRAGGSRLATEMSKGTRFQLYLALRLAGYEEFARARPAVPFIADDIMETFDEPRSEEVLRLLAALSRQGQVIYLTHHRHLCDLARRVEPGVRLHEIAS